MLHGRLTFRCITESGKGDISSDDVVCGNFRLSPTSAHRGAPVPSIARLSFPLDACREAQKFTFLCSLPGRQV